MTAKTRRSPAKELIIQAAALRNTQDYAGALGLIEANIGSFEGIDRIHGWLQGFYAAKEGGMLDKARALAHQIHTEDPAIPSVNEFLSGDSSAA